MSLKIKIIAPDQTIWDTEAEEIILPTSTGQLGILVGHAPLLTALDIGVMRVKIQKSWTPLVLLGGFAEVEDNLITILVNGAERADEIDLTVAQNNLEKAITNTEKAITNRDKIEAAKNLSKSRARVQAALAVK
nr:ATP synthase CF1 epsilon subunit [Cavernulicola chilensis]